LLLHFIISDPRFAKANDLALQVTMAYFAVAAHIETERNET